MNRSRGSWMVAAACAVVLAYGSAARVESQADAGKPDIDKKAVALLKKSEGALAKVRTLTAELESQRALPDGGKALTKKTIKLMRPNFMSVVDSFTFLKPTGEVRLSGTSNELSDGGYFWYFSLGERPYLSRRLVDPRGRGIFFGELPEPLSGFFEAPVLSTGMLKNPVPGLVKSLKYIGREEWERENYDVIEWTYELFGYRLPKDSPLSQSRLYIGRDDLVHRVLTRNQKRGNPWSEWNESALRHIKVGVDLQASDFKLPALGNLQAKDGESLKGILQIGERAPDFTLPTPTGGQVTLAGLLRGKKALVIWQWFYY
jgi:hypothetical protein